jgi:transcription factor SPT20
MRLISSTKIHSSPLRFSTWQSQEAEPLYHDINNEDSNQVNSKDNSKESKPLEKTVTRVLLRPKSEILFAHLCLLNQKTGSKCTDKDALEIEAK